MSDTSAIPASQASNPLARALDLEVGKLELLRLKAWQALSLAIMGASLCLALANGTNQGLGAASVGALSLVWFTLARIALERGKYNTFVAFITFVIEQTVPWGIYLAIFVTAGAEQATRVWGPPLVYTGMLILTTLKLSPRYSILTGVLGGAQYLVLSIVVVHPRLPVGEMVETTTTGGDFVRTIMLVTGGFVVAVVAVGLRAAVGAVVSTVRERDLFGKYRLEREIASGGMGIVWRATYCPEGGFARPAAVKLVHPHLAKDETFVDAFRHEAELCARLVHQNIVQVFDFGRVDDRYFLAMEFVDGLTLRDVMKRANHAQMRIPPAVAGAIARQILAGLHFAHVDAHDAGGAQLRVIHRDLAPSNILVSTSGEVKVSDFGIAKALREVTAVKTNTVAGHFDHMAPEQTSAGGLDERTDLFCVGILVWEMLTSTALFRRSNDAATLHAVSLAPIPAPSSVDPALAPFDALSAIMLARDPNARFQTARDMSEAIRAAVGPALGDAIARFVESLPPLPKKTPASQATPRAPGPPPLPGKAPATRVIDESAASGVDTADERPVTATTRDPPKRAGDAARDTTLLD